MTTEPPSGVGAGADRGLARARRLTRWLDTRYLDPLLGLVAPGVGDAIGTVGGLYLVVVAVRLGAPRVVVARMLLNLAVDGLLGVVPFAGDLFDFAFRAHRRNLALLEARAAESPARLRSHPLDFLLVGGAALLLLAALAAPFVLAAFGLRALWRGATPSASG